MIHLNYNKHKAKERKNIVNVRIINEKGKTEKVCVTLFAASRNH